MNSGINVEYEEVSNRTRKITVRRDDEILGYLKYSEYPEHNFIYIDFLEIYEPYRKNGLAMLLYKEFSKVYNSQYPNWKIGRTFINPVAEYTFTKAVAEGLFPEFVLNNAKRDYTPEEEEKLYNELLPKITDLRRQKVSSV